MRLAAVLAFAVSLGALGCASEPRADSGELATPDGLDRTSLYGVYGAFAKPTAALEGYRRVHFERGGLTYRDAPRYPRGRRVPPLALASTVELSTEDEARLWRHYEEVFTREFSTDSGLTPAAEAGPGTLTVRAHLLDLVVHQSGEMVGSESRYSRRSPVLTIVLDVRDSLTGEPLARIVDRRSTVSSNRVSRQTGSSRIDAAGLRQQMVRWARALRKHLHQLRG